MRSVVVAFGPRRAYPNHRTCAFLVRRPGRTPSPQDLQLEAPPQYALAGNPVISPHLPLRASLFAAGCIGRPLPVCLLSHLRNSQGSQKRLSGIRSGRAGLSQHHRAGRMYLLLDASVALYQFVCFPIYGIPKVPRKDYLVFDRGVLAYLNTIEKVGCIYCSYANGLLALITEIAART